MSMLKDILIPAGAFIVGVIVKTVGDNVLTDFYSSTKRKVIKPKNIVISESQKTIDYKVHRGWSMTVPNSLSITIPINIYNPNNEVVAIEALDGAVIDEQGDKPSYINVMLIDFTSKNDIIAHKTITWDVTFSVNYPNNTQVGIEQAITSYLDYVRELPEKIILSINCKYSIDGESKKITTDINTKIKERIAVNWLDFIKANRPSNPDLSSTIENTISELEKISS